MTLGLIVRADNGGLGNLTWEVARHARPDRVLIMDCGTAGRGALHLDRFHALDGSWVVQYSDLYLPSVRDFLTGLDTVFSAETFYDARICDMAAGLGVRRVLYVMPELYNPNDPAEVADDYYLPCPRAELGDVPTPDFPSLPMPVALDRFPERPSRRGPIEFMGAPAAAMCDRNGQSPFHEAGMRLALDGSIPGESWSYVQHTEPENYWEQYTADVLVLPRRYGALSLPMLEAAAAGMAIITTDLAPQNQSGMHALFVEAPTSRKVPMKGGSWDVHDPDVDRLLEVMRECVEHPAKTRLWGRMTRAWAERRSWDVLLPAWNAVLRP